MQTHTHRADDEHKTLNHYAVYRMDDQTTHSWGKNEVRNILPQQSIQAHLSIPPCCSSAPPPLAPTYNKKTKQNRTSDKSAQTCFYKETAESK